MARGINKVILIGHLGQDPEVKHQPGGLVVCNIIASLGARMNDEEWKVYAKKLIKS